MRLAIVGSTGFVGRAVSLQARAKGLDVLPLSGLRVVMPIRKRRPEDGVENWVRTHDRDFGKLVERLGGVDVVVNAAGLAKPESKDAEALVLANGIMPGVLAAASAAAGVRRMVHVSSAAVQGRCNPLDESTATHPLTPYGRSKALAEKILLEQDVTTPVEMIIYRPTSVQGAERSMTRALVKLSSLPLSPVAGKGDAPVPVALIQNVAAAIVHLSCTPSSPLIALHPWEKMTVRSLFLAFGAKNLLSVPQPVARAGLLGIRVVTPLSPRLAAVARRLDVIVLGQRQDARALPNGGFVLPAGPDAYVELGQRIRRGASHPSVK